MNPVELTHIERRGKDTYGDLTIRREWIGEQRSIPVRTPAGRTIQVGLHPAMTEGALLRFQGQVSDGDGDLFLRIRLASEGSGRSDPADRSTDRERRKRRNGRVIMSCWAIGAGLIFVLFYDGWLINAVPARWVGYFFIGMGVLELFGLNLFFRGGPLDRRIDRPGD